MMQDKQLYIIDGHALVFKMYYALLGRPMLSSKGRDTSILYGFTKYLFELLAKRQPTHLAVCFDPPGGTFRNQLYPEYKANRGETPQLVIEALEPLCEICKALRIPVYLIPGYEADDVAGTLAKSGEREGFTVYMVTPDKDYGQLVSEHIYQYKPGKKGGDDEILGVKEVCEKYGIDRPEQVIEVLTLCGDASDNVPGVKGVGEVGAGKLLRSYGTVENIYAHLDELSERQKAMFEEARGHIALSHELVTIKTDVPMEISFREMEVTNEYEPRIVELFDEYEFHSLKKNICHIHAGPAACADKQADLSYRSASPAEVATAARKAGLCALVWDTDGQFAAAADGQNGTVCANGSAEDFAVLVSDPSVALAGFDIKSLWRAGLSPAGKYFDAELMHYLVNPERSHGIESVAMEFLGLDLQEEEGASTGDLFAETESTENERERLCRKAVATLRLKDKLLEALQKNGAEKLYLEMEEPLVDVLTDMEKTGVKVDLDSLKEFADGLRSEAAELERRIRELTGEPTLNISSPKQIAAVLYEKLKINPKAKPGSRAAYATDEETLSAFADRHPSIPLILEYRAVKKLLSTYIEPFPNFVSPKTGRIHTTFNQAQTATGRLSSSKPNLQNIPIRTERGQNIRKAFVSAREDGIIVSADYSQIELRIMAHLCGDEHLRKAFLSGEDVHRATAAKIFGVAPEAVTDAQRRMAKTANFGIMYGISSFGLAQRLGVGRGEAKALIDGYFAQFPAIAAYMEKVKAEGRERGYVQTLFGRRRYLPDLLSHNANVRAMAERNAINAPIQGTSADIIKLAMIRVEALLKAEGFRSKMILQIHDELVFDAYPEEVERLKAKVKEVMENVASLSVPLTVECGEGKNWFEAH